MCHILYRKLLLLMSTKWTECHWYDTASSTIDRYPFRRLFQCRILYDENGLLHLYQKKISFQLTERMVALIECSLHRFHFSSFSIIRLWPIPFHLIFDLFSVFSSFCPTFSVQLKYCDGVKSVSLALLNIFVVEFVRYILHFHRRWHLLLNVYWPCLMQHQQQQQQQTIVIRSDTLRIISLSLSLRSVSTLNAHHSTLQQTNFVHTFVPLAVCYFHFLAHEPTAVREFSIFLSNCNENKILANSRYFYR